MQNEGGEKFLHKKDCTFDNIQPFNYLKHL